MSDIIDFGKKPKVFFLVVKDKATLEISQKPSFNQNPISLVGIASILMKGYRKAPGNTLLVLQNPGSPSNFSGMTGNKSR